MDVLIEKFSTSLVKDKIEVPVLPDVAMKVMSMANDENSSAQALSDLIHKDQTLAGHVLRLANSSAYGGSVKIVSLQQAIARMGMKVIREIALSISVKNSVYKVRGKDAVIKELWQRSVATSAFAKEIARLQRRNIEISFLCGLLCDIGKPIALNKLSELEKEYDERIDDERTLSILEDFHQFIGLKLCEEWELPMQVSEAIAHYKEPHKAKKFAEECHTITLAKLLCEHFFDAEKVSEEDIFQSSSVEILNIYQDELADILVKREKIEDLIGSMGI